MFTDRLKDVLEGGSDLLRAEAELAGMRLKRMLLNSAVVGLSGAVALTGAGLIVGAAGVELAARWGTGPALGTIGAGLLIVGGLGLLVVRAVGDRGDGGSVEADSHAPPPAIKAEAAKAQIEDALGADTQGGNHQQAHDIGKAAMEIALKHPAAVGSAAFLVISLLGPRRTLRTVGRGVAAAGLMGTLLDSIKDGPGQNGSPVTARSAEAVTKEELMRRAAMLARQTKHRA